MTFVLKPFELLYRAINRIRRAAYRNGILKAKRLPAPVISVGNIAIGGGGKTPVVIAIVRALTERGMRAGVLTRGYGRSGEGGIVDTLDAARYGDEPVLIKKNVPKADVIVGSNRYRNGLRNKCDVYVLDDGFQHLELERDLDLVVDAPHAKHLREGRQALRYADIVIPRRLRIEVPPHIRGKRVYAFAGLANNDQFFQSLRDEGLHIIGTRAFGDHHRYTTAEIASIKIAAAGADAIITTEKDAVKITDPSIIAIHAEAVIDPAVLERIVAATNR